MATRSVKTCLEGPDPAVPFPPGFEVAIIGQTFEVGHDNAVSEGRVVKCVLVDAGLRAELTVEWEESE